MVCRRCAQLQNTAHTYLASRGDGEACIWACVGGGRVRVSSVEVPDWRVSRVIGVLIMIGILRFGKGVVEIHAMTNLTHESHVLLQISFEQLSA